MEEDWDAKFSFKYFQVRADGLLIPIHVWEKENRPFNVKVDLAAEEVCREAVARRGFDAPQDRNYAIFEVTLPNFGNFIVIL